MSFILDYERNSAVHKIKELFESHNSFVGIGKAHLLYFGESFRLNIRVYACHTLHVIVVENHGNAVARKLDIHFYRIVVFYRVFESRRAVFGYAVTVQTSMRHGAFQKPEIVFYSRLHFAILSVLYFAGIHPSGSMLSR